MDAIIIDAEVGPDRRLIYELPPQVPVGPVKLVIQPLQAPSLQTGRGLTREEARRRLLAAGLLLTERVAPEGAVESDEQEHQRLAALFGQGPSLEELIDQDRGPRE
jgi:hypothetical protein